jgi:hypothetical protein
LGRQDYRRLVLVLLDAGSVSPVTGGNYGGAGVGNFVDGTDLVHGITLREIAGYGTNVQCLRSRCRYTETITIKSKRDKVFAIAERLVGKVGTRCMRCKTLIRKEQAPG